jgi:O-antigen ligase
MYVTYSRAAIISLFGLAVVVAWRLNRRLGQLVFVVGIVAGILLLPTYLQLRGQAGSQGSLGPGSLLVASDRDRITGWQAAIGMVEEQPLTGQGFLAYKQLADAFGDPVLGSPHNEWLRLFAEEGVIGGIVGLCFAATTLSWLIHGRGALATGILAGTAGYFTMASFNNPLLFVQVSSVVYPLIALVVVSVWSSRRDEHTDVADAVTSDDHDEGAIVPEPGQPGTNLSPGAQ